MTTTGSRPRSLARSALNSACVALALAGCAASTSTLTTGTSGTGTATSYPDPAGAVTGTVRVLAAASLTDPLTALAKEFEAAHPGVQVALSFGSSTTLAQQVAEGADVDLFVSAGTRALDQLPASVKAAPTTTIAKNVLEIATPPGNPSKVNGLAALAAPHLDVVLCAATVPCGSAADAILTKAGINAHIVSREVDVKATLAKITLGEADAALVYHSDVVSAGPRVTGVEIPPEQNTTLDYPLVTVGSSGAAKEFAAFVRGPSGAKTLAAAGFLAP